MMARWTEEDKLRALAIAEASSIREASKQTGISKTTISRWISEAKNGVSHETGQHGTLKKADQIAKEAVEEAKEEVREYVADRVKQVADQIMAVNELALREIEQVIRDGPKDDESNAQWLRSLVGVVSQGIEKHQLLMGKPTARQEVQGKVETTHEQHYHIIQELVNKDDEVADRILDALRRQGDM